MRLTAILRASRVPVSQFTWLAPLKVAQLQRIARATGIQSSGTKNVLTARIEAALCQRLVIPAQEKNRNDWSVLSIDMGIQNLAFAHLRVPRASLIQTAAPAPPRPVLTAWHRLKVSEIGTLDLEGTGARIDVAGIVSDPEAESLPSTKTVKAKAKPAAGLKEAFSPDLYAATAYTLITSLLSAYKPTHILIERQRFRSGSGSAVQEWTIRVGVLEGMLHAVLHTLRHERGSELAEIEVQGIEPKRVVQYWEDLDSDTAPRSEDSTKKGRVSAREVKKAKIDLVGRWLNSTLDSNISENGASSSSGEMEPGATLDRKICLAADMSALHDLAGAYLRKWRGEGTRKKSLSVADSGNAIGKLDDLADCLLQGVTWVEWQAMRERLARQGFEAIERT